MHPANDLWLLWLLTVLLGLNLSWLIAYHLSQLTSVASRASSKPRIPKPLTPRSENDCPHCRTKPARFTRLLSWPKAWEGESTTGKIIAFPALNGAWPEPYDALTD